jgi:hypothetical protein
MPAKSSPAQNTGPSAARTTPVASLSPVLPVVPARRALWFPGDITPQSLQRHAATSGATTRGAA